MKVQIPADIAQAIANEKIRYLQEERKDLPLGTIMAFLWRKQLARIAELEAMIPPKPAMTTEELAAKTGFKFTRIN